jgi:hypothetical protein
MLQKGQKVAPETQEGGLRQSTHFLDKNLIVADGLINRRNSRYLKDLPLSEVNKNIRISPFSKVPAKVMVLGVMASDGKKCLIIFIPDGQKVIH